MNSPQGAIYARVSSDQQAEAHTVASQVAALRERVAAEGWTVSMSTPQIVWPANTRIRCCWSMSSGAPGSRSFFSTEL